MGSTSIIEPQGSVEKSRSLSAARLRRPRWRDPRLLIGIVLISLSVAGVVALVSSQSRTVSVYAAESAVSVGDPLHAEDLREIAVRIEDPAQRYLIADEPLPEDMQFIRAVGEGELIPRSVLDTSDPLARRAVTVEVQHELARAVQRGRPVDVWAASAVASTTETSEVDQLVASAEVVDIREESSAFGAQGSVTVELLVAEDELSGLLAAEGSGAGLSVLPAVLDE